VPFHPDYAQFRRRVAASDAIATRMVYRSNQEYAEEVIDRRPDLQDIHAGFARAGVAGDQSVCLVGYVVRDNRQYVMLIRFATQDVHTFPDEPVLGEGETQEELVRQSLEHSRTVAAGIEDRVRRDRILCFLDSAASRSPAAALELFALDSMQVAIFVDMDDAQQGVELAGSVPPERYKNYVIRIIAFFLYYQEQYRGDDTAFREALLGIDANILQSVAIFARVLASGETTFGPNFFRLRDWVRTQQQNPDSIYSCYTST
jgi:hypothetical protein